MAKRIVTVSPQPSNPVSHIADLIHVALERRCGYSAASQKEFQQALAIVVGLSFTAILSEGSRLESCKPHLDFFLKCREFTQHTDDLKKLSVSISEIVSNAVYPFSVLGRPNYYADFMEAMVALLKSSPDADDTEADKRMLEMILRELFSRCH
jgi:hypothetical protein